MNRIISIVLSLFVLLLAGGCQYNTAYGIEPGKYVCETPYMTITMPDDDNNAYSKDYVEINQEVYEVSSSIGYGGDLDYYLYNEKYLASPDMPFEGDIDGSFLIRYHYKYDKKNKEFIVTTDKKNGNVYHLKKVE